jgi:hypothetical protein
MGSKAPRRCAAMTRPLASTRRPLDMSPQHPRHEPQTRGPYDTRNNITQFKVDISCMESAQYKSFDHDEDTEPCGVSCFNIRVCQIQMPKGFQLPSDTPKYDRTQEPKIWLEDYLTVIRVHGGTRTTTIHCLQLPLKGSARAWLKSLSAEIAY